MGEERQPPRIENAPGLVWRGRAGAWVATWQARTDLVAKGYAPQTARLWKGDEPNAIEAEMIATQCRRLQSDMKMWGVTESYVTAPAAVTTLRSLINHYQTDPDSAYHSKRYQTRKSYDAMNNRIVLLHGEDSLTDIDARWLLSKHRQWTDNGKKVSIGHSFIGHLRTLFGFGATIMKDPECRRIRNDLRDMKFPMGKPREVHLTADMVTEHRAKAHGRGWDYMALADAFQFDCTLRQKDVIGEWVPVSEPGMSDITFKGEKWMTGLRWEEIDENLILRHVTSKRQKLIQIDLKLAPMVLEEFEKLLGEPVVLVDETTKAPTVLRCLLPPSGPVILCEVTGYPWSPSEFRRKWRYVANLAGLPKNVRSMDARAGAITEATEAGAQLEDIRHAATHSDIAMTQRYSRGAADKVSNVMQLRLAHRNKPKTE